MPNSAWMMSSRAMGSIVACQYMELLPTQPNMEAKVSGIALPARARSVHANSITMIKEHW